MYLTNSPLLTRDAWAVCCSEVALTTEGSADTPGDKSTAKSLPSLFCLHLWITSDLTPTEAPRQHSCVPSQQLPKPIPLSLMPPTDFIYAVKMSIFPLVLK